jgi:lysophospholipase L1-like esterase
VPYTRYTRYIALGDSMSIDLYPALDAGEIDVAVALERVPTAGRVARLGAASLFFQNDDDHWPEEVADDLVTRYPGIRVFNLASDGATIGEVFGEQVPQVDPEDEPTLVTLTIGGNDLLSAFGNRPRPALLARIAADIAEAYELLLDSVRRMSTECTVIVTTVFDPSDGTGTIPGVSELTGPLPVGVLDQFNAHIRTLAGGTPNVLLADAHRHFLGHGITAPEADRWYWRRSLIEPNARGASEIRGLWRTALASASDW